MLRSALLAIMLVFRMPELTVCVCNYVFVSFVRQCQMLCCRDCDAKVADPREAFLMSAEGPQGTYVNPGGFVHETLTLHKAQGLRCLNEEPSTEYSWFPGCEITFEMTFSLY